MNNEGDVTIKRDGAVARVRFFHPKKNALPGSLLNALAETIASLGKDEAVRVIVLESGDRGPFCAGASFDELLAVDDFESGKTFFMGFARMILAMKEAPCFIIARVHGKAVGGGIGMVAAADYALATDRAAIKLSELALGIGPFVVGPAVERKVGPAAFSVMAIDADWHSAKWALDRGLYAEVHPDLQSLDRAVDALATRLAGFSPLAQSDLKRVLWEGTEHWDELLESRAEISGRLVLSEYTRAAIDAFRAPRNQRDQE